MAHPKDCEFVGIRGDHVIVYDGRKFFLAECWSATLRGRVKTYKRSGVSPAHCASSQDQFFAVESQHVKAAQWMLCSERSDNAFVYYATMDDLAAALESKSAKRDRP